MELKLVIKTGRSAVVEFDDGGKYYSKEEYTLLVNGIWQDRKGCYNNIWS